MKSKILIFLILFFFTGCSNKKVITTSAFIQISGMKNYIITDIAEAYATNNLVQEATSVKSIDDFEVEFLVLVDEDGAESMFNTNKSMFENSKESTFSTTLFGLLNYEAYESTNNDYYMYICRVDNTLLIAKALEKDKNQLKKFIKELGYYVE